MPLIGTTNEEKIWNYLKSKGLSDYGVAGLMGNLYAESGLRPNNLQNTYEGKLGMADAEYTELVDKGSYKNFGNDRAGYGLAQWTHPDRKPKLLAYAKATGRSIGDLEMQLEFLLKELAESFKSVLSVLKTAVSVQDASDIVLLKFECPADQSKERQKERAGYGQKYFDKYVKKGSEGPVAKLTPNAVYTVNGVTINEKIIPDGTRWQDATKAKKAGFSAGALYKSQKKLCGTGRAGNVTIHNTNDFPNVNDDGEQYTRATFNQNMNSSRVHFFVDDTGGWQNLKAGTGMVPSDPVGAAEVSWHSGDGSVADGGNMTSLSIEIIMNESPEHDKIARDNGARLAAWLLWKNGLTIDKLVTHTYWVNKSAGKKFSDVDEQCCNPISGKKWCPTYIFGSSNKTTAMKNWKAFKALVKSYLDALNGGSAPTTSTKPEGTLSQASAFVPRLTRPEAGNKYYITKASGGYSSAVKGSPTDALCDVLANCVGYAYGRFNEIVGEGACKYLSPVNAENFMQYKGELEVGTEPRLGACMVWQKGSTLKGTDGAGHVAIVEKVISATEVVTSESGWKASKPFWTQTRKKGTGNWGQGTGYKFLGFIYNPAKCCRGTVPVSKPTTATPTTTMKKATEAAKSLKKSLAGTYVVTAESGLHLRAGAGTNKASMILLPKGTKVQNYGYYTEINGVAWLYIQVTYRGVRYTGFSSGAYLSKT